MELRGESIFTILIFCEYTHKVVTTHTSAIRKNNNINNYVLVIVDITIYVTLIIYIIFTLLLLFQSSFCTFLSVMVKFTIVTK